MSVMARSIRKVVTGVKTLEGAGFTVERPFPGRATVEDADPFLLLDRFGPVNYGPGEAKGAPWHPHRGFETVTYLLQGEFQHRDSMGNSGTLRAGDAQWMTAGSGIIHDEEPSDAMKKKGGRMEGFQLWVNLPRSQKMCEPKYQDIGKDNIPEAKFDNVSARVIAGEAFGVKGAVSTTQPISYIDFTAQKGAEFTHKIDTEMNNGFVFVYRGSGLFGKELKAIGDGQCGFIDDVGTDFPVKIAADAGCRFLLITGRRLNEPIVQRGPFVMNTQEEIREAFTDYYENKLVRHTAKFASKAEHTEEYDPSKASIL